MRAMFSVNWCFRARVDKTTSYTTHTSQWIYAWGLPAFHSCFRGSVNILRHSHHPRHQQLGYFCLPVLFQGMR